MLKFIRDQKTSSPEELAYKNITKEDLEKTLKESLTPREEKIIKLRYGLEDDMPRNLKEVGEEMNLSRERVRQIQKKALEKMRRKEKLKKLQ